MKPMHANEGPADTVFKTVMDVLAFPARLQGYALNALLNTIDKAQTDAVMKESADIQKKRESK